MTAITVPWTQLTPRRGIRARLAWVSPALFWGAACATLFAVLAGLTWGRWTVSAFPLDAGREMIVPQMLLDGHILYRDIRCFYGPLGYWLNAGLAYLLGTGPEAFWLANMLRFGATVVLLWMLARRLLRPSLAAGAMACGAYGLFFSFAVPYSAGIGWGGLLLTAGLLCMANAFDAKPVRPQRPEDEGAPAGSKSLSWAIAAGVMLSLAASTKQEYALASSILMVLLICDHLLASKSNRWAGLAALLASIVVPFATVAALVLTRVPISVLLHENLWIPELMEYLGGGTSYCLDYLLNPRRLVNLFELAVLVMVSAALVSAVFTKSGGRRVWLLVVGCVLMVGAADAYARFLPRSSWNVFAYPKPRYRELVEALPMLCLPLSLITLAVLARRMWKAGVASTWMSITGEHRLGIACSLVCLSFTMREVPGWAELLRQPLTPIVAVWLFAVMIPRLMRWKDMPATTWTSGVAVLLVAGSAVALDNTLFYQRRPCAWVQGAAGRTYAWQRRKPFTPDYFKSAVSLVESHRDRIAGRTLACVPEGAWVNAVCGIPWASRDTQWLPYFQSWIVDDIGKQPPTFVLVMEPLEGLARVGELLRSDYEVVATNEYGMVLYEHGSSRHEPACVALTGEGK